MKILYILFVSIVSPIVMATEALPLGDISEISYRSGYVTFKVIGPDGQNYCDACPTDPGSRSAKKCWIKEERQFQLTMLLAGQVRGKKVYGRVRNFQTNCDVYQMSIED